MTYLNDEAVDWVFERSVSVANDKLVLLVIARRANKHWASFPSKAEIARITGLSEASLPRSFKRLEDEGHMVRVAFAGGNQQEQKIGFVLAGCGRPLDALDADFLASAFAKRKQLGTPLATKPQHWSGKRTGEGRTAATPQGRTAATPRSNKYNEDQKEGEEGALAQAPDTSEAPSTAAAIAEVAAAAPPPTSGSLARKPARIPKQRQSRTSNSKRDADWRAQIAAADLDELDGVADAHDGHGKSAYRKASFRLGFGTDGAVPDGLRPQYIRHMYLYLLKDVAATDPGHLDEFLYPLDPSVEADPAPYKWNDYEFAPAGETAKSFSTRMLQVAVQMRPEQLGPWAAEIEDRLPDLWYKARHQVRKEITALGMPLEIETIASAAVRHLIQHYANKPHPKWPAEVVPPSMRTVASITEAPSWAA